MNTHVGALTCLVIPCHLKTLQFDFPKAVVLTHAPLSSSLTALPPPPDQATTKDSPEQSHVLCEASPDQYISYPGPSSPEWLLCSLTSVTHLSKSFFYPCTVSRLLLQLDITRSEWNIVLSLPLVDVCLLIWGGEKWLVSLLHSYWLIIHSKCVMSLASGWLMGPGTSCVCPVTHTVFLSGTCSPLALCL